MFLTFVKILFYLLQKTLTLENNLLQPVDIGEKGEKIVVEYLKKVKGYSDVKLNTQGAGATDIEAVGTKTCLLVQVKAAAVQPNVPSHLTNDEETRIKSRASNIAAEAWEARVILTSQLEFAGPILWRKLL